MATIALYASKINNMPSLIKEVKSSVKDLKSELTSFKNKCQSVNRNICNLDDVISSISTSTQTQEQKVTSLENFSKDVEQFASDVVQVDGNVADIVNKNKDGFYNKYSYLKPDCEKGFLEKAWDDCKSGLKSVGEWCKEHWKLVVTIILVVVAVVLICTGVGGALAPLLAMIAKGIIMGAVIGGVAGGTISALMGGSFFEGFENGAFSGAISGAISGGMGYGMSSGGKVALSLFKTMLIGATAETGASLLGDFGDIAIKGEDISVGDILFNASFSAILGGTAGMASYGLAKLFPIKPLSGITKGRGSWLHVWGTQSTKAVRYSTHMSTKTILKGIGANIVKDMWDYAIEPVKSWIGEVVDDWNVQPQN